jgi:transaldolase/glucose-6-phosphate isomerase
MTDDRASAWLGAVMGEGALAGRDKLTFVLPPAIAAFGDWVEQLVAESTGKEGTGIIPVPGEDLGPPEVYGADRLFVALGDDPRLGPLREAGHPVVTLPAPGLRDLGAQIFRFELATAVAGHVLKINAFDQPNVEEAKQATRDILAGGRLESPDPGDAGALLAAAQPGDYVAIQAYIDRTDATEAALQADRLAIRDRLRVATTLGFGPRFLHSTGQLHKGGPPSGIFLQITDGADSLGDSDRDVDLDIPAQPFTFGTLIDAQALGDLKALRSRGRRVARVSLKEMGDLARSNT